MMLAIMSAAVVAVFFMASTAAADEGNDFSNNLFSDLAPLLALFGERVTTQFMSQAMGWADNIILAMAPLGIVTIIVSAIRVGGPIWLKAIIGRARENRAVAEGELMSSTSNEVCELWNGQKVVRVAGEAPIVEFICLLPRTKEGTNKPTNDKGATSAHLTTDSSTKMNPVSNVVPSSASLAPSVHSSLLDLEQDPFEVVSLTDAVKKNYLREVDRDILGFERAPHKKRWHDPEKIRHPAKDSQIPETTKFIIVRNKEDAAPNLLLNIDRFSSQGELWTVAVIGIVLQIGALLYSGFITYYPILMFRKAGLPIADYAYPCTVIGTSLLVSGLLVCSHVVESSTYEKMYRPNGLEARIIYLQKNGTVNDQSFGSFAIFAKESKPVIVMSRRARIGSVLEIKTVIGTLISLSGFVIQFVGLRSMHWSATVVQLGVTVAMTVLRAFVRRDLANITTTEKLSPGFELDWLATKLAMKYFPGLPENGNDKDKKNSPPLSKGQRAKVRGTAGSSDWLERPKGNKMSNGGGAQDNATTADEAQSWIIRGIQTSEILDPKKLKASAAHNAMRLRKGLADLAPWPRPLSAQSRAVATAIETTLNFLDDQSAFSRSKNNIDRSTTNDSESDGSESDGSESDGSENDGDVKDSLVWHVESLHGGKIYFRVCKQPNGRWKASETEIEAALSLWNYGAHLHQPETKLSHTTRSDDVSPPDVGSTPQHVLRLLGLNSARLRRDLRWWLPNETAKIMAVSRFSKPAGEVDVQDEEVNVQDGECSGIIGCAPSHCIPGWIETLRYKAMELQRPYDTTSQFTHPDLYLAIISENPARLLFAQHLFTAFMWALAKELRQPVKGRARVQASDLSQLDSSLSWQLFTLQNVHLSRMAQDIHATGLGSLEDIYLCIIPPLSLAHRLPQADSVVDWAHQHVVRPGLTGRWTEAVDAFTWLLGTFPKGDPVGIHVVPATVSLLLSLAGELKTRERQKYEKTPDYWLKQLKKEVETKLKAAGTAQRSLAVYDIHGPSWISEAAKTIELGILPRKRLRYLRHIEVVLKGSGWSQMDEPTYPENLGKRDAQGRTALHYASIKDSYWFPKLLAVYPNVNVQDRLGWTPLHFASSLATDTNNVFKLIQAGADMGIRSEDGMTPLHYAAMAGSVHVVVELVNAGADVNGTDRWRNTALHWAAFNGHDEVVRYLLPLTYPTLRTIGGRTVLHQAVLGDKCTALQLQSILKHGYEATAKDRQGRTALHYAAWKGHGLAVSFLVAQFGQNGADPHMTDREGMRPVDLAARGGFQEIAIDLLLADGETLQTRLKHRDDNNATILHHAAAGNCDTLLQYLISEAHMSLSETGRYKGTALHYAAESGSKAVLEVLVEKKADLWLKEVSGLTALHLAAKHGHQDCVEYLADQLAGGGTQWPVTSAGKTPLHTAARAGHTDIVRNLLKKGCPVDQQDDNGCTALHNAAESYDSATAKLLLEWEPQKERANVLTNDRNEPLAYAAMKGDLEMVKLLVTKGANVHNENEQGMTPFLVAIGGWFIEAGIRWKRAENSITRMEQRVDIMRFLVQSGANPNVVDKNGENAYTLLFSDRHGNWDREDADGRQRRPIAMYLEALSLTGSP